VRNTGFIAVISGILGLYVLIHVYLLKRLSRTLSGTGSLRTVVLALVVLWALSFFLARFVLERHPGPLADGVLLAGYFYLALFNVTLWLTLAYDLLRLADKVRPFLPAAVRRDARAGGGEAFVYIVAAAALICVLGAWNARSIRVRSLALDIPKEAAGFRELKVALASDLHLSPVLRAPFLGRVLDPIVSFEPDLVLLPGDLIDEDASPKERVRLTELLRTLKPRLGVFACPGNHEYYAGLEKSLATLAEGGIRVLLDEAVLVGDAFYVAGRRDYTESRMGGTRAPLRDVLAGLDPAKPVILLDHQPRAFDEAAGNGVDLTLSGHTHNGQMFPITLINKFVYKVNWGLARRGDAYFYVTSGAGTWGPPVRLGSSPEVVLITLRFKRPSS
jgi:hypothetical protein